jgi:hypothetical protein
MSVSTQPRTTTSGSGDRLTSIAYQPKSKLLILEFPREGAYLYHNVPVGTYEMLKHSPIVRASFVKGRGRRYSVVTTA